VLKLAVTRYDLNYLLQNQTQTLRYVNGRPQPAHIGPMLKNCKLLLNCQ